MTREEMIETLPHALDKIEKLESDRAAAEKVRQSEEEAHAQEVANLRTKKGAKDRESAEKDARIAALEKELSESKASTVDANHQAARQDKFSGTSKKGIDRKHQTKKVRDDDKGDFDGTPGSSAREESKGIQLNHLPRIGRPAVNYALNMQSRMFRWREDADYDLDNNWCERAARSHQLSRKTSLHTGSHRGAKVRAILRSFVET